MKGPRRHRRKSTSFSRHFRKKACDQYPERFIQDKDYRELTRAERKNRKGHKYEMLRTRAVMTRIKGLTINHPLFKLEPTGLLHIKIGYRWDGPSGVTVDTPSFMRGSAVHDVWFQILREFFKLNIEFIQTLNIDPALLRLRIFHDANKDLCLHCKQDGMMWPRYNIVYWAVEKFGKKHAGGV